jgi:hypothetical protein
MKNLFKLLLAGTFLFTFAVKSFSQTTATASSSQTTLSIQEKADKIAMDMSKAATLTAAQVKQITPYIIELLKQKDIDVAQYKDNDEALLKAKNDRQAVCNAKIKAVVTDDQFAKIKIYWESKKKQNNDKTK